MLRHEIHRRAKHIQPCARFHRLCGKMAAEGTRARQAIVESENVPRHRSERHAISKPRVDVRHESFKRGMSARYRRRFAEEGRIDRHENRRVLIGGAADHHAVEMRELGLHLADLDQATVEHDRHIWKFGLQRPDARVIERRNAAVFAR